jgi:hypothetical protein
MEEKRTALACRTLGAAGRRTDAARVVPQGQGFSPKRLAIHKTMSADIIPKTHFTMDGQCSAKIPGIDFCSLDNCSRPSSVIVIFIMAQTRPLPPLTSLPFMNPASLNSTSASRSSRLVPPSRNSGSVNCDNPRKSLICLFRAVSVRLPFDPERPFASGFILCLVTYWLFAMLMQVLGLIQ